MNKFIFRGKPVRLGRFGEVREGDVLVLTDQEAEDIVSDKRFEFAADAPASKPKLVPISAKLTGDERAAAEKANREEEARVARLAQANDQNAVELLEIKSKTFDELTAMAEEINSREKKAIFDVRKSSKAELIRSLINYRRKEQGKRSEAAEEDEE